MSDLIITLHALGLIAWNFSPVIGAYMIVALYAYITRNEGR